MLSISSRNFSYGKWALRSEEHTSELQSPCNHVCRLLLEKKNKENNLVELHLSRLNLEPSHSPMSNHFDVALLLLQPCHVYEVIRMLHAMLYASRSVDQSH